MHGNGMCVLQSKGALSEAPSFKEVSLEQHTYSSPQ